MSQDALSEESPFHAREFFHDQPGYWPWVKQDVDDAAMESDDAALSPASRRAMFGMDRMHAALSDSGSDDEDLPETPGRTGNDAEKRIWREDKMGVLRLSESLLPSRWDFDDRRENTPRPASSPVIFLRLSEREMLITPILRLRSVQQGV